MVLKAQEYISVIASMLSAAACLSALIIMAVVMKRTMAGARERLIVSLLLAGFITSLDHLIPSSMILFKDEKLQFGLACTINGFIGQFAAQAMDFSTLAIALVTYFVLMSKNGDQVLSRVVRYFGWIIGAVWCVPLGTATIGYFLVGYGPAGSWCWFQGEPREKVTLVRFGLTQGPRMLIFIIILFTYLRVFFKLHTRYGIQQRKDAIYTANCGDNYSIPISHSLIKSNHEAPSSISTQIGKSSILKSKIAEREAEWRAQEERNKEVIAAIYRMMLYPLIYLFFWFCGLANRIVEAMGDQNEFTMLLQSLSKFLPMVDAIAYTLTIKHQIMEAIKR